MSRYAVGRDLFVRDCFAGADPAHRVRVRVVTEQAWHSLFAYNMFLRPADGATTWTASSRTSRSSTSATSRRPATRRRPRTRRRSSCCTWGAGSCSSAARATRARSRSRSSRRSTTCSRAKGVFPMHCSANVGAERRRRRSSSASPAPARRRSRPTPRRTLIGDDEHGWSDDGVFNFEGGCYAKAIKLSRRGRAGDLRHDAHFGHRARERGPRRRRGPIDFDDAGVTENTRVSYPIDSIPNASPTGRPAHPQTSSSSPPTPSACCRRSRGSRPSRRCTTSSRATRPRSPAPSAA